MPRAPGPDRDAWRPKECPNQNSLGGLWQCSAPNRGYPRSAMSKGRVEAFSDGVFAVAATLLIFNVQLDKTAPGGLLAALLAAWPKYAAYVAGFLTIGVMWLNHHGLFERIFHLDRTLVFLNLLLLMAIVFIPFSTAELGSNILVPRDANTAASLYAINASLIAVLFGAVWMYALTRPHLLSDRKSTRLNSSHRTISYAVFCLKKK